MNYDSAALSSLRSTGRYEYKKSASGLRRQGLSKSTCAFFHSVVHSTGSVNDVVCLLDACAADELISAAFVIHHWRRAVAGQLHQGARLHLRSYAASSIRGINESRTVLRSLKLRTVLRTSFNEPQGPQPPQWKYDTNEILRVSESFTRICSGMRLRVCVFVVAGLTWIPGNGENCAD